MHDVITICGFPLSTQVSPTEPLPPFSYSPRIQAPHRNQQCGNQTMNNDQCRCSSSSDGHNTTTDDRTTTMQCDKVLSVPP